MNYHICMNLNTAIDMCLNLPSNPFGGNGFYKIRDILGLPEGTKQGDVLRDLKEMQAEGYTAIPSEGCDHHLNGHCKGHPTPRPVADNARRYHK